jgi:hypothetical protein
MSEVRQAIGVGDRGLALRSIEDMFRFAQYCVKSGITPKGDTPEAVLVKVQAAAELGISPMRGLQSLYVVNGRIAMMEKLASALIIASGVLTLDGQIVTWFTGKEYEDDYTCHVRSRRHGQALANETTFSVKDAKLARLWGKDLYSQYPKRMLSARAKQHHYQDYFGDVTMGLALADTVVDDSVTLGGRPAMSALPAPITTDPADGEPDPIFETVGRVTNVVDENGEVEADQ